MAMRHLPGADSLALRLRDAGLADELIAECLAVEREALVSGATDWLARHDASDLTAVAIAPDLGERYLDTLYHTNWVQDLYGDDVLRSDELTVGVRVS